METFIRRSVVKDEYGNEIMKVMINRPDKKNALNHELYTLLANAISEAEKDTGIRAIFLHGTDDCFTSGNDIADFQSVVASNDEFPVARFLRTLRDAQKPIVAAVTGLAIGIGTTMLLHCDLVYAAANARFQLPFVDLGLCPEAASSFLLPQLVGHQRASELLLLGEPFSAEKACEMGLVNRVCRDEEVLQFGLLQAQKLAAKSPTSVRLTKALTKKSVSRSIAETVEEEGRQFFERLSSAEAKEAFAAFLERRKPDFSSFA